MWNTSYVIGEDTLSGWGKRYFFTYYNDFDDEKPIMDVVLEVAIFVVIFIVSVVTNIIIAVCVFRYPDMKTVTNSFILNLAAADILFAATMPVVAYVRTTASWQLGDVTCKMLPYIQALAGIVLLWTLTLISMDRYRCIVVPPYRSKITNRRASCYCLLCWLLTAIAISPIILYFRQQRTTSGVFVCTIIFPRNDVVDYSIFFIIPLIFTCLLPMLILVYNYQKIFQKILSTKSTWASSCVMVSSTPPQSKQARRQSEVSLTDIFVPWPGRKCSNSQVNPNGRHGSLTQHEEQRLNKHIKCVRVLFLNVLMVLLMWLPITIVMTLIFIDGHRPNADTNFFLSTKHFIVSLIVAFLNTVVNPLLYGVLSDSFRACLVHLCCGRWCSREDNNNQHVLKENTVTPSSCRNLPSAACVNISTIAAASAAAVVNTSSGLSKSCSRDRRHSGMNSSSDFN